MKKFMKILKYFFLVLIFFNLNQLKAEDRDNQLNQLFNQLKTDKSTLILDI